MTICSMICRVLACDDARHHCRSHPFDSLTSTDTNTDADALLTALAHARAQREQARTRLRHLLAYGREFIHPRPYTLAALAHAVDMSISGVRTGYHQDDISAVADLLNRAPHRRQS